ncbi:hypothetical protein REPUB_Repub02eG0200600 [Reevesia pubescens]
MLKEDMLVACSQKRDASSQAPPPPSVYLVYYHRTGKATYSFYGLEIAGVENEQTKPLPEPLFRFSSKNFPVGPSFVALDSKIYAIGGLIPAFIRGKDKYSLDTYMFDTKNPIPPRSEDYDPKDFFIKGPRLNAPQISPILVTFEGRIYAFPSSFSRHSMTLPKCEMLNLGVGTWIPLPDPPLLDQHEKYQPSENYSVKGYAVHDDTFVASTPKGIYCLNLTNPTEWRHVQLWGGVSRFPFSKEAICIDEEYFAIVMNARKQALCKYDKGLTEEKDLVNLRSNYKYLKYQNHLVVHLRDNMLCTIINGLDTPPKSFPPYGCSNVICFDIFQVTEHQKKKNQSKLAHLASSTFTMDDNPGSHGFLTGCFPKQVKILSKDPETIKSLILFTYALSNMGTVVASIPILPGWIELTRVTVIGRDGLSSSQGTLQENRFLN